jgi:hypothetical protein
MGGNGVAYTGARLPEMEKRCFWVTTPTGSATLLQGQNTSEGEVGHLTSPAYHCNGRSRRNFGRG